MLHFCTYFDSGFLPKGLALIDSLKAHTPDFSITILALDDKAYTELEKRKDPVIELIGLQQYKDYFDIDESKYADKKQFYFSITPNICLYLFETRPELNRIFYLDADLYFFQSANILLQEMGEHSILICSHHFNPLHQLIATHYGHFNVAINGFVNNEEGLQCLRSWKQDCESWYPGMPGYPHSFFSDQIFLDTWPSKYSSLKIVTNKGIDVAPWNLNNIRITRRNGVFLANGEPLMVYHFSSLVKTGTNTWKTNTAKFFVSVKGDVLALYKQYIQQIEGYGYENRIVQTLNFKAGSLRRLVQKVSGKLFNEFVEV